MSGTIGKELRPLVRKARDQGWRERSSKNGLLLYPPDGSRPIPVHGSPSQGRSRSTANAIAQFRRAGLEV